MTIWEAKYVFVGLRHRDAEIIAAGYGVHLITNPSQHEPGRKSVLVSYLHGRVREILAILE